MSDIIENVPIPTQEAPIALGQPSQQERPSISPKQTEANETPAPEIIKNTDEWIKNGLSAKSEEEINERIKILLESQSLHFEDDAEFNEVLEMIGQGNTDIEYISQRMDRTTRGKLLGQIAYLQDYRDLKNGNLEFSLPKAREVELLRHDIDENKLSSFREGIRSKLEQSGRTDAEKLSEELTVVIQKMMDSEIPEIRLAGTRLLAGKFGEKAEPVEIFFSDSVPYPAAAGYDVRYVGSQENGYIITINPKKFLDNFTIIEKQLALTHEMNHVDFFSKQRFSNYAEVVSWFQNRRNEVRAEQRAIYGDISVLRQAATYIANDRSAGNEFLDISETVWKTLELANKVNATMEEVNGDIYIASLYGLVHARAPLNKDRVELLERIVNRDIEQYRKTGKVRGYVA